MVRSLYRCHNPKANVFEMRLGYPIGNLANLESFNWMVIHTEILMKVLESQY